MQTKLLLTPRLLSAIIDKVHEENLPIEINSGDKKDGLVDVLFVYPDTFHNAFDPLMDNTFNEVFGPLEGGEQ